ncbi:Prostaglandin reductase 1 [Amphibalanus amphitrite]|uniref:Prostaglandin reductase 1 n=1 Tax=Amphibalanus amphitrite TaxID=1232801 RepID=A0A6A4XEQ2_AMPAM|nr:Prostaglandin reductase 1 [Amphibalanus amphitrite]
MLVRLGSGRRPVRESAAPATCSKVRANYICRGTSERCPRSLLARDMSGSARVWVLAARPQGAAKASDFQLQDEPLAEPQEGEVLLEAEFLSVDPFMRAFASQLPLNEPMPGTQVARVVQSRIVNAAAGAVGSVVGQLGKLLGARVIGYAGDQEKVDWLKSTLKLDEAFNYKTQDLAETLRSAAPDGVNCYFDAVGGKFSQTVVQHMADGGRIACIGASSGYNSAAPPTTGPFPEISIITKQLTISGFQYFAQDLTSEKMQKARAKLAQLVADGKLEARQTFTDGFQNMAQALLDMMDGKNTGKMVVRV